MLNGNTSNLEKLLHAAKKKCMHEVIFPKSAIEALFLHLQVMNHSIFFILETAEKVKTQKFFFFRSSKLSNRGIC